jgi:hypothetical protein
MSYDRHQHIRRLEDRLSLVSTWVAARRDAGVHHVQQLHAQLESAQRSLRAATAQVLQDAPACARAAADEVERDMEPDCGAAPPRPGFRREGLRALRRCMQLTFALAPHLPNLDDPGWRSAHEAYERSRDEVYRVFEGAAGAPVERR